MLDTGAPFYEVYETSDGKYMSVGSIEPQFYRELLIGLGLDDEVAALTATQQDRSTWPATKDRFASIFATRTRVEWEDEFAERDACVAPVLELDEAIEHPHLRERGTYAEYFGLTQPSPAPRFSSTPSAVTAAPPRPAEHSADVLRDWGIGEVDELLAAGVVIDETSGARA
jgi:alpha-methylacyl-CoA racemase